MAALSADATRDYRGTDNLREEVFSVATSATLYIGSLCVFDTNGRVRAASAAASRRPAGVCTGVINESGSQITAITGNAGGTVKVKVAWGHEVLCNVLTAARTNVNLGKNVFIGTDNDVTDTTGAGTAAVRIKIGSITEFTNSAKSEAWVALRVYGDADAT